jgi:SpoVK/Ycf46/Vps4 family AAA+-type ATPase
MKLTDKSIKMLQELGVSLFSKNRKSKDTIQPEDIKPKELVFNQEENKQLDLIKKLLQEKHLQETRLRLLDKNLPQGIAILLHGAPGTGKTETVYQVARETGREILKVEISESKSMWFGESEKIIKRIFTDYHSYAADCTRLPILLFNEADSILSRRKSLDSSGVAKTENAMQGIILEELERFNGIFMATTNLVGNLDAAFDRRFLFKVEFRQPDVPARARIWKLKIPSLTKKECESLADRFEFSGGQIDNIARKAEIQGIVYGKKFRMEQLVEFCESEQLVKSNARPVVGFRLPRDPVT